MRKTVKVKGSHNLKMTPEFFEAVKKGKKTFEIRLNDRDYKIGDRIILKEYQSKKYTGREIIGQITYITDYEQKEGYIVFSFKKISITSRKDDGKYERGYKKTAAF